MVEFVNEVETVKYVEHVLRHRWKRWKSFLLQFKILNQRPFGKISGTQNVKSTYYSFQVHSIKFWNPWSFLRKQIILSLDQTQDNLQIISINQNDSSISILQDTIQINIYLYFSVHLKIKTKISNTHLTSKSKKISF